MPIIDLNAPQLGDVLDTPKGFVVTPGEEEVNKGSDAPSWSSTFGAAFRQDNTVGSFLATGNPSQVNDDTFNPWDEIKGTKYEPQFSSFVDVRNRQAFDTMKAKLDQETEDRKMLDAAPWYQSLISQGTAGALDLPSLIPGGAFVKGAKGGFSVAKSAMSVGAAAGVSSAIQETALQNMQETRTAGESAVNIGASVLLGGLLGAGGAKLLSPAEWSSAVAKLESELATGAADIERGLSGSPASVGAAANEPTSLADNAIAGRAASAVASSTAQLNPALRALTSPSASYREEATKLFENSLYLKKNDAGVASEPAVETFMKEWNAGLATAVKNTEGAFSDYVKASGGGKMAEMAPGRFGLMTRSEFREEVGRAMRRGDESANPHVAKVAKEWRAKVFEPLKEAAIKVGLLPEDVSVDTAQSYFSRMWNQQKLVAQEGRFKQIVIDHYQKKLDKEFSSSVESHAARLARIDQEIADLNIPPDQRLGTLNTLERQIAEHEAQWPSLADAADELSDLRGQMAVARRAGDKAAIARLKDEEKLVRERFPGDALTAFMKTRSDLRGRRRNVDLSAAGLQERSERIANAMEDAEEANFRAMERLIKKGQKLERDLDRLDADAFEARVNQIADGYGAIARKAEASAARAEQTIANIKKRAEAATTRDETLAARSATEAKFGPADEAAGKLAAAKEAAGRNAAKRAAADEAIQKRLEVEAQRQRDMAEQMDKISERLRVAREFDHDGLMAELRAGMERAARIASSSSMERGARVARLGERMAAVDPERVVARVKTLNEMKVGLETRFIDRWEIGRGAMDVDPTARLAKFDEASRQIADEVFNSLTGKLDGGPRPEFITIKSRGPMKERTFHIPDELIEDFLESDIDVVGRRYARVMGADVELARKFGSVDMVDQIGKIREDYKRLRGLAETEKERLALNKREKADIGDLEAMRDMLRGTNPTNPWDQSFSRMVRSVNHVNYLRSMGEVAIASLAETVRPAMVHGLLPYMQTIGQLATNLKGIKMSVAEAQLAGNVVERALGQRLATLSDIADPYASRGPVEAFLENMTNVASRWNGIRMLTDMQKSIASVMTQNRLLQGVENYGKSTDKRYLAYVGIDQSMAERIAKQFAEHGETVENVRVANTEKWTDEVARRTYRAAINKDVDSIITTKGVADTPLFANTPTGRAMLQFKSFALASHQRVLLRGLQEDQTRFIGGLLAMSMAGMFATWLKAVSGNRMEKLQDVGKNPGWWVSEGLDRSGVFSVPMELANTFEKATGLNPVKTPLKAFDEGSAQSQRMQNRSLMGAIAGPSMGLVDDAGSVLGIPKKVVQGEEVTRGQKNAAERLLPFNSYVGMRQMLRYVINPDAARP